jgi:hypothetical protein
MNPLESRKRLLIAESELNRAQLAREWAAMTADVRSITSRARSFGAITSAAALLVAGLVAVRRSKAADANAKPSWWQTLFRGTRLVSTVWLALRAKRRDQANK